MKKQVIIKDERPVTTPDKVDFNKIYGVKMLDGKAVISTVNGRYEVVSVSNITVHSIYPYFTSNALSTCVEQLVREKRDVFEFDNDKEFGAWLAE